MQGLGLAGLTQLWRWVAELAVGHFSVFPDGGADWSPKWLSPEVTVVAGMKTRTTKARKYFPFCTKRKMKALRILQKSYLRTVNSLVA